MDVMTAGANVPAFACGIITNNDTIYNTHRVNQYKMLVSENIIIMYEKLLLEIRGISDEL